MAKWLRVDCNHRRHPKFRKAGFWGALVTDAAWEICKEYDLDGRLPAIYWDPVYIAEHLMADKEFPADAVEYVQKGMEAAIAVGLMHETGGGVIINDWEEHQREVSTDRVRRHRARKRKANQGDLFGEESNNETVSETDGNFSERNHTEQNHTEQNGTLPTKKPDSGNGSRPEWQLLLNYYYDQCKELHSFTPVLKYEGADGGTSKAILREYSLERGKRFVDRYLALRDKSIKNAGYPFAWIPSRIGQLAGKEGDAERGKAIQARMRQAGLLVDAR